MHHSGLGDTSDSLHLKCPNLTNIIIYLNRVKGWKGGLKKVNWYLVKILGNYGGTPGNSLFPTPKHNNLGQILNLNIKFFSA